MGMNGVLKHLAEMTSAVDALLDRVIAFGDTIDELIDECDSIASDEIDVRLKPGLWGDILRDVIDELLFQIDKACDVEKSLVAPLFSNQEFAPKCWEAINFANSHLHQVTSGTPSGLVNSAFDCILAQFEFVTGLLHDREEPLKSIVSLSKEIGSADDLTFIAALARTLCQNHLCLNEDFDFEALRSRLQLECKNAIEWIKLEDANSSSITQVLSDVSPGPLAEEASRILRDLYKYSELHVDSIRQFRDHVLELDDAFEIAEGAVDLLKINRDECQMRISSLGSDAKLEADSAFDAAARFPVSCSCGTHCESTHAYVTHLSEWLINFAPQHLDQTRRRADHRRELYSHVENFKCSEVLRKLSDEFNSAMHVLGIFQTVDAQVNSDRDYHPAMPPAHWEKKTGMSRDTLLRLEKSGKLRIERVGKKWRVHRDDISKIVEL